MWKHLVANALTLFILGLVGVVALLAWGQAQYRAEGPLEIATCVRVESGTTMRRLSRDLEDRGAVSHGTIFRLGADYSGKTAELKAGSFLVPARAPMDEIVDIVTKGGRSTCGTEVLYRIGVVAEKVEVRELDPATNRFATVAEFDPVPAEGDPEPDPEAVARYEKVRAEDDTRYRIALAEGVTSWQIVEGLKAADFLDGDVAEVPPEGSLAPDSYEVTPGTERAEVLAEMTERQTARLDEAWQNRAPGIPVETPEEALVLASIIEKETGVAEERPQVASVFVNRLKQGMMLQTDPTVIYGVTGGKGVLGRGLRRSELDRDTPYNTYRNQGLPPTPIANPGEASISAATNPADTDFLFFVADGSGGHVFSKTLDEHNTNVAKWRALEKQDAETGGN